MRKMPRDKFMCLILSGDRDAAVRFLVGAESEKNDGEWTTGEVMGLHTGDLKPMIEWSGNDLLAYYDLLFDGEGEPR
jgi:hypothetical protein